MTYLSAKVACAAFLLAILAGGAVAQKEAPKKQMIDAPQTPAVTIPLSAGTAINASLVGALDSERNKAGDTVSAIVTESVTYQRSVLVPKGSRLLGHVVRTGSSGAEKSALFVEFDRVVLKGGQEALLNAGIQALAPLGAPSTIPSREKYEENRMAGSSRSASGFTGTQVLPSTYTVPRKSIADVPAQRIEGGLDRQGFFTPDSKGAFSDPNLKVFTPVSEGSHGTVLVGTNKNVRLENGTRLLIVIQPPAAAAPAPAVAAPNGR